MDPINSSESVKWPTSSISSVFTPTSAQNCLRTTIISYEIATPALPLIAKILMLSNEEIKSLENDQETRQKITLLYQTASLELQEKRFISEEEHLFH